MYNIKDFHEIVNEATETTYAITKNVIISSLNNIVCQKILYKFRLPDGNIVGIVFTTNNSNTVLCTINKIDINNNILGSISIKREYFKKFVATEQIIYGRFIKEHPNYLFVKK